MGDENTKKAVSVEVASKALELGTRGVEVYRRAALLAHNPGLQEEAAALVDDLLRKRSTWVPRIILVCPDTVNELLPVVRADIRAAHLIVQLRQKITRYDGWAAFHYRNAWMVKRSDRLIYFDNGDRESGSSSTAAKARSAEIAVTPVRL